MKKPDRIIKWENPGPHYELDFDNRVESWSIGGFMLVRFVVKLTGKRTGAGQNHYWNDLEMSMKELLVW
jgi:hypothetical protein